MQAISKDYKYRNWFVDFNVSYFHPFSNSLRSVIGNGGVDYQLALTYKWNRYFGVFVSGDYFYKNGHSTGSGSKSNLWIAPLTVGLKGSVDFLQSGYHVLQGYCVLAPRWYFVGAKNEVNYLEHHNFAQGFGGVGGLGLSYLYKHLTINAFVNASLATVEADSDRSYVKTPNTQVGGVSAGGGIGWNY